MNRSFFVLILSTVLGAVFGTPRTARADSGPARLVLIVANNRGTELGRADLHYADDDGAKYRALFRMGTSTPADVQLLARFDRDTSRLFPEAPEGVPTRAALEQKVTALVARSAELRRAGREVELLFIYAGHGDVDRGKGFIQLEDGAFTADDLAALVRRVDATRAHVILDSCNSLFLVSPRKPGGRHVATSDDAVRALRERLPRVGVFLSTSADGEVFEWSELGAGIFSHAVRSGLAGAADADGDGHVSYAELRAFVEIATRDVKNPRYRPKVFARGPDGNDSASLFSVRSAAGRRVVIEGPIRTTFRDADEVPWVDAHVESGARVEILVPPLLDGKGSQELLDVSGATPKVVRRERLDAPDVEGAGGTSPDVTPPATIAARGVSEVFRALFVHPFGARAMAAMARAPDADDLVPETYGLSHDDVTRFSLLLRQVSDAERSRRQLAGLAVLSGGIVSAAVGTVLVVRNDDERSNAVGAAYLGSGIALAVLSPFIGFRPGPGEKLRADFESRLASGTSPSDAIGRAETRLEELARQERTSRILGAVALGLFVGLEGTAFALNELRDAPDAQLRGILASGALIASVGAVMMLQPTPIERLAEVWRSEPSRSTAHVRLSPIGPGGPGVSMIGRF